jgi:hypothetical protein
VASGSEELQLAQTKLRTEEEKRKTEEARNEGRRLDGKAKGVRGASLTPSQLSRRMPSRRVELWFVAKDMKFNLVKVEEVKSDKGKAKTKRFTSGDARSLEMFTQARTVKDDKKIDVSEDCVQAAWLPSHRKIFEVAAVEGVHWRDLHDRNWLSFPGLEKNAEAPDGVAEERSSTGTPDPRTVRAFVDNKRSRRGEFSDDDRGKLFRYCTIVLEHYQPFRHFMGAALFDGQFAQCFRVIRGDNKFLVEDGRVLNLSKQGDAQLYAGFLCSRNAQGCNIVHVAGAELGSVLGGGGTGIVYKLKQFDNGVVKVPFDHTVDIVHHERTVYLALAAKQVFSPGLSRLMPGTEDSKEPWLILQGYFSRLIVEAPFDITKLCSLIDREDAPLRALHTGGFLHCDVRPDNILCILDDVDRLALVDLGASRLCDNNAPFRHGGISFASDRVLNAFKNKTEDFKFCIADDLISLVRCVFVFDQKADSYKDVIWGLGRDPDKLVEFWQTAFSPNRYPKGEAMMKAASEGNYDDLCKAITRAFLSTVSE